MLDIFEIVKGRFTSFLTSLLVELENREKSLVSARALCYRMEFVTVQLSVGSVNSLA